MKNDSSLLSRNFGDKNRRSVDTDLFLCYTFNMKKFLLFLISFLTLNLYGQSQYTTTVIKTNYTSTSKMVWNFREDKWDFVDNHDRIVFPASWTFRVNSNNEGMVTTGTINYDILEYKYINQTTIFFRLLNIKVNREMEMLVIKKDGVFLLAIFDQAERTAYFFI